MRLAVVGLPSALFSVVLLAGCGDVESGAPPPVDTVTQELVLHERSLAVTDEKILQPFTLERVMLQIVATSNVPGADHIKLFQQWWDTQNQGPGLGMGPHCDDETTNGQPSLNGFEWECPRGEGYQANIDPFEGAPDEHLYMPIGLFNRFDLTPANGGHCGEYRIVFAMRPGHQHSQGRNFLIFEAVMPNPYPDMGLQGCYPVAEFWYNLSFENDPAVRQKLLMGFYFKGIKGFPPAVHANHYGSQLTDGGYGCSTGQIRTNQFAGGEWNLREFRLTNDCRCKHCFLVIVPTTTKDNPYGGLWDGNSGDPMASLLHTTAIGAVGSLGTGGVNQLGWSVPNKVNSGESIAIQNGPYDYLHIFNGPGSGSPFWNDLDNEVNSVWSGSFSTDQIVTRAQTQSCAGCHHTTNNGDIGQGGPWPESLKFVHVEEFVSGGQFPLSMAMHKHFLPHRAQILDDFIASGGTTTQSNTKCEFPQPPELKVDCKSDAVRDVTLRPFKPSGLEALKLPIGRKGTLGGSKVH